MSQIIDTANGKGIPATYLPRAAGDRDKDDQYHETLGGALVAASATGLIHYKNLLMKAGDLSGVFDSPTPTLGGTNDVHVAVINSTFSTICLSQDFLDVHGGTQLLYPTYGGKHHQIPPAITHPAYPAQFLLGCGIFAYDDNAWGHCSGTMMFSTEADGKGLQTALAFLPKNNLVSVATDLGPYRGDGKKFYDSTVDSGPSSVSASATTDGIKMEAAIHGLSIVLRFSNVLSDHTVAEGETLTDIADAYYHNTTVAAHIERANPGKIPNPNKLPAGLKLKLPDLI